MAIFGNFKGTTQPEFKVGKTGAVIHGNTTPPASPTAGDIWLDKNNATIRVFTSNTWSSIGSNLSGLNVDSGTLYVDSANDTVSIGSVSSNEKLFVNGSIRLGTNPAIKYAGAYLDLQHASTTGTVLRVRDNTGNTNPVFTVFSANNNSEVFKVQGASVTINGYTMPIADGSADQVITSYGNGTLYFKTVSAGAAAGANTTVQFNSGGSFAGNTRFTYDSANSSLTVPNLVITGNVDIFTDYGGINESVTRIQDYGNLNQSVQFNDFSVETVGPGSLSYSYGNTSGIFTYNGPSNAEIRAAFSAGTGISITDGVISASGSSYNAANVAITGGAINNTTIGATTRAAGSFTSLSADDTFTATGGLTLTGTTGTGTSQFATGATTSGNTKTLNIGTGGLSGSTTAITIGAAAGTSTIALNGTVTISSSNVLTASTANTAIDARVSGGAGLTYSNGVLAVGAGAGITVNADNIALTSGIVTAGTYGSASAVGQVAVDTYGRVTSASNVAISVTSGQVSDFSTAVRSNISVTDSGGDGSLSYSNTTGIITYTGPSQAEANTRIDARLSGGTGITYNSGVIATTITQYTDALARAAISVTDAGGDGSLSYNNTTGVITYTGPSQTEANTRIDARLSGGTGVTYSSGVISIGQNVASNANVSFNRISNLATPSAPSDAVNKQYVDDVAQGLHTHDACSAASNATLASITGGTITYNNGTAGVGANLVVTGGPTFATIDGVPLSNGMRILVKNEANVAHNGIYERTSTTVLTRASDFDSPDEMAGGDFTFVTGGTLYDNTGWVMPDPVTTVGTTAITWVQFSGAGAFTAGNALVLTGTEFNVVTAATGGIEIVSDALQLKSSVAGTGLTYSSGVITANATYIKGLFSASDSGGDGSFSYNDGVFTYTGPSQAEANTRIDARLSGGTGITYSSGVIATTITQYTDALARAAISVTDSGGDGSLSYNNTTGVITYTGPSQAEANTRVDARLSGGTGVTYSSGVIAIGQAVGTTSNVTFQNISTTGLTATGGNASINLGATNSVALSATAPPTVDMFTITNTGQAVTTAGVSAMQVNYIGGTGAIEASAIRSDMTPGATSGSTWNAFRVAATAAAGTGVTFNGMKFDNKTAGAGTSRAFYVGTGYDEILNYNGTIVINGTGIINGAQLGNLTANAVVIGNGTSAVTSVSPGTVGNVLTSNGTNWVSQAAAGGGGGGGITTGKAIAMAMIFG
jgi:hypothetical protein